MVVCVWLARSRGGNPQEFSGVSMLFDRYMVFDLQCKLSSNI